MNWRHAIDQFYRYVIAPRTIPAGVHRPGRPVFPAHVPAQNPLTADVADQARWEAAQRLMQDDTYGYVLLTVHKEAVGPVAEIRLAQDVDPTWWPAIEGTLDQILAATRELP